jgi:hypothetical protein
MKNSSPAILLLIFSIAIFSCNRTNNEALIFNGKIVIIQSAVASDINAFEDIMAKFSPSDDINTLASDAKQVIEKIDNGIKEIEALDTPKGGDEFKKTLLTELKFIKQLYSKVLQLGQESTTAQEKAQIVADFSTAEKEAEVLKKNSLSSQREFMKNNKIELAPSNN